MNDSHPFQLLRRCGDTVFRFFIRRTVFLYTVVAIVLAGLINWGQATVNYLNGFHGVEEDIHFFVVGKLELDPDLMKWGVRYFSELARVDPSNGFFQGNLGFCYYYQDQTGRAIAAYKKAAQLIPGYYPHHMDLGMIYYNQGEYTLAAEYLQNTVNRFKGTLAHYVHLGEQLNRLRQVKANDLIAKLNVQALEDSQLTYQLLCQTQFFLKNFPVMREVAAMGLKAHPDNFEIRCFAGISQLFMKQYPEAVQQFSEAVRLNPRDERGRYLLNLSVGLRTGRIPYSPQAVLAHPEVYVLVPVNPAKLHYYWDLKIIELQLNYTLNGKAL